jgi:hypothetical protein
MITPFRAAIAAVAAASASPGLMRCTPKAEATRYLIRDRDQPQTNSGTAHTIPA